MPHEKDAMARVLRSIAPLYELMDRFDAAEASYAEACRVQTGARRPPCIQ
jgi:hypothetical protein